MDIDSMIAVLRAAKEGKVIQAKHHDGVWRDSDPSWNFRSNEYRVKPEPVVVGLDVCLREYGLSALTSTKDVNLELTFEEGKLTGAKVL